jgi:menaquinone-dependent protoporphyrinogen IX oxidase
MTAKTLFDDFYWEGYYPLQQLLQKLIPKWNETEEYTDNINTNESFHRGIRFHYRATNDQSLAEYEKLLIRKTTNYENNSDASSIESYNSIKRYKRINAFQDTVQHNRSHTTESQATSHSTWKGWGSPDTGTHHTTNQGSIPNDNTQVSVSSAGTLSTITASDLTRQFNEQFDAYQAKINAQSVSQETFNSSIRSAILKQQESFSNHQQSMDSIAKNVASLTESGDNRYNRLFSAIQELNDKFMMILGNSPQNQRFDELVHPSQNPAQIQLPPSPTASDSSMLHADSQESPPVSRSLMARFQGVQQLGRQQQQQQQQDTDTSMMFVGEGNVAFSPLG